MASGSKPPISHPGTLGDMARLLSAIERAAPVPEPNVKLEDTQFRVRGLQDDSGPRSVGGGVDASLGQFGLEICGKRWQPTESSIFNFKSIPQLPRPPLPLPVTPHSWLWPHFGEWQVRGLHIPRPVRPAAVKYVMNDQQMASNHGQVMGANSFGNIATASGLVRPSAAAESGSGASAGFPLPSSSGYYPMNVMTPNRMMSSSGLVPGLVGLSSNPGNPSSSFLAPGPLASTSSVISRGRAQALGGGMNLRDEVTACIGAGPSGHIEPQQQHRSPIPRVWKPKHSDGVKRVPPRRSGCLLFEKRLSTSDVSCKRNDVTLPLAELEAIYHDVSRRNEPIAVDVQVGRDGEQQSPVFTCEIKWWQKESGGYYSLTKSRELKKYFGASTGQFLACYSTNTGGWRFVVQDSPTQIMYQPRMKRPHLDPTNFDEPKAKRSNTLQTGDSAAGAGNGI